MKVLAKATKKMFDNYKAEIKLIFNISRLSYPFDIGVKTHFGNFHQRISNIMKNKNSQSVLNNISSVRRNEQGEGDKVMK